MGQKVTTVIGWMLGLILAYILVSNFKGTTSIVGTLLKGSPAVISALQGVGPGYPAPAR
jgi:uncharacterized membrane protein